MKKKKFLAILIATVMVLVMLPASLFAATTTVSTATELASAITAAAAGDTIKLTAAITGIQQMLIEKTITIDMNGFNISGNPTSYTAFRVVAGGDLTLSNTGVTQSQLLVGTGLTAEYNYEGIRIAGAGKATVGSNVSIETGLPVFIIGNGTAGSAQLYVYGKLLVTDEISAGIAYSAIQGNGTSDGTIINIYTGAEVMNSYSGAIYHPQAGILNIFGGTISGVGFAIGIKDGTLNISGGTIQATGTLITPPAVNNSGINPSGCAIQIESNDGYGTVAVNITGGNISSLNGYALYEYLSNPGTTTGTKVSRISVTGGTLTSGGTLPDMLLSAELTAKGVVTTNGTEVTANADVTYTVIIPASVDFGTIYKNSGTKTKDFPITVQDALLEAGKAITVTQTSTGLTMSAGSSTLAFTFTPPTGLFVFAGNGTKTGTVACDTTGLTAAGSYKGYMTFSVTYGA